MRIIAGDLIGTEPNYTEKGRSIQNNVHLARQILEGIEDDNEAMLINLDQFKAFDLVDHWCLAAVLEPLDSKQGSANG